jgi:hypothetical protein
MSRRLLAVTTLLALPFASAHDPAGTPKTYCEDPAEWEYHDYTAISGVGSISVRPSAVDSNLQDCNANGTFFDYDGHHEWAAGWARIAVQTGPCSPELGHHPAFGRFVVEDNLAGRTVPYLVMADSVNLVPPTDPSAPDCGDGQINPCAGGPCVGGDPVTLCVGICTVTFPPGLDGSYIVVVFTDGGPATGGHIRTCTDACD